MLDVGHSDSLKADGFNAFREAQKGGLHIFRKCRDLRIDHRT